VRGALWSSTKPYVSLTGTSMAAPVVSGTVALMLQANPNLTPNMVKAILQYTAQTHSDYNALTQGAGFLNSKGAVDLAKFFGAPAGKAYPDLAVVGQADPLGQPAHRRRRHPPDRQRVGPQHRVGHRLRPRG
jgi:subtilisin family serine protease